MKKRGAKAGLWLALAVVAGSWLGVSTACYADAKAEANTDNFIWNRSSDSDG